MDCVLIDAKNPRYEYLVEPALESDGTLKKDSNGNNILYYEKDDSGNRAKGLVIDAKWQHVEELGYTPFHATSYDNEQHGKDLYAAIMNGDYGAIAAAQDKSGVTDAP
mgnify:CR=1 FL=1|tara:strand:+ start:322 stop:645 length:324 start_codon:yes stop_codon:yes gene_type:complete